MVVAFVDIVCAHVTRFIKHNTFVGEEDDYAEDNDADGDDDGDDDADDEDHCLHRV